MAEEKDLGTPESNSSPLEKDAESALGGDVLVSLTGPAAKLISVLETERGGYVTESELCIETGLNQKTLQGLVATIPKLISSVVIETIRGAGGETHYRAEFAELSGTHVPYGKTFEEKEIIQVPVEKIVDREIVREVPVPKPMPIDVGSAWLAPAIVKGSSKKSSERKPVVEEVNGTQFVWPATPASEPSVPGFITPPWYSRLKSLVEWPKGHVQLVGPPSVGKTTAVSQLASEFDKPLIHLEGNQSLQVRDFAGFGEIRSGASSFAVALYGAAVVRGWWVCLDEANALSGGELMFLNGQLAPPYSIALHGMQFPVHSDFRLFITYNRGLIGTRGMPPAFVDRLSPIEVTYPDDDTLSAMLIQHGADKHVLPALLEFSHKMWTSRLTYHLSLRRLFDAIKLYTKDGYTLKMSLECAVLPLAPEGETDAIKKVISDVATKPYVAIK